MNSSLLYNFRTRDYINADKSELQLKNVSIVNLPQRCTSPDPAKSMNTMFPTSAWSKVVNS